MNGSAQKYLLSVEKLGVSKFAVQGEFEDNMPYSSL